MQRIIVWLSVFVQVSWQQKDPLNDFCRRFGHQTAVIDNHLYIDGGFVDWNPISQNIQNYSNTWLLFNDLTTSPAGVGMPQLHANLSKNASIPDVSGGVLWADDVNKRFYLYGGDYNGISPNAPDLLSYDVIYDQWEYFGVPNTPINSVSWGGGVGISELGHGYMFGGWLSNASVPGWSGGPLATSTLIKYQMDTGVWTNNTGPDDTPRAEGVLVYIPASESGLLVYFGGVTAPYGNSTIVESPMKTIYVYDIASGRWYTQNATGDIPPNRRRFCAGAAWAQDQSSYNIYMYGGLGFGANYSGFDDIYILSLPSFQWIQWWEGASPQNPHNSLSCNVVNQGQMLVIGGTFPLTENCDYTPTWGTHNMDLGKQSGSQWSDYRQNISAYVVPPEIVAVVGGSSLGGATATAPVGGFKNGDLSVYFTQHASVASRSPTRSIPTPTNTSNSTIPTQAPPPSMALSTGAIAGIAVGGAVVLLALALGVYCLRRHKQNKANPHLAGNNMTGPDNSEVSHTPQSPYRTPYRQSARYQLEDNFIPAEPVELSGNNHEAHEVDPNKGSIIHHGIDEHQQPLYTKYYQPQSSPSLLSPPFSTISAGTEYPDFNADTTYQPQTSPAPTYSSTGRTLRKPRNRNK